MLFNPKADNIKRINWRKKMGVDLWEEKGNRHLDVSIDAKAAPYHVVSARLVAKYLPQRGRVLDIGCGLGQIDCLIKEARPDCRLNIADAYQVCLNIVSGKVEVENSFLLPEDQFNLEIVGVGYDVVVMSHVLEHLLNPVDAIHKALCVINSGGYLVLSVPNPVRPQVIFSNLFKKHYVNRGHVFAWDRSHWINFIENILDLDVVEYVSDSVNVFPGLVRRSMPGIVNSIEVWLAKVLPWFSFSNMVVIRKA